MTTTTQRTALTFLAQPGAFAFREDGTWLTAHAVSGKKVRHSTIEALMTRGLVRAVAGENGGGARFYITSEGRFALATENTVT